MYYVYTLKSEIDDSLYIGYTGDLRKRFAEHNQGRTKSIKHKLPLKLVYYEAYKNKTDARKREFSLKKNSYRKERLIKRLSNSLR